MSEGTTQATTSETSASTSTQQGLADTATTTATTTEQSAATTTAAATTSQTGLEFIPESYRGSQWAQKYKTPDEFFKGVDNMASMMGKKEIVQGLQVPGEKATEDEVKAFYTALGVPESADKYTLPDLQIAEGFDIAAEKKSFAEIAHKVKIPPKQAEELFKAYIEKTNEKFKAIEDKKVQSFDEAVKTAFGDDVQKNLGLAKKGAKTLGIANTLDNEKLSSNPTVLKLCAELGKYVGEDSLETGRSSDTKETLVEEAKRLQATAEYKAGDPTTVSKVRELFKKAYPN